MNREVGRRCEEVGIFPTAPLCFASPAPFWRRKNDEWAVAHRYFSAESMNKRFQPSNEEVVKALLELESA